MRASDVPALTCAPCVTPQILRTQSNIVDGKLPLPPTPGPAAVAGVAGSEPNGAAAGSRGADGPASTSGRQAEAASRAGQGLEVWGRQATALMRCCCGRALQSMLHSRSSPRPSMTGVMLCCALLNQVELVDVSFGYQQERPVSACCQGRGAPPSSPGWDGALRALQHPQLYRPWYSPFS
jgi:hypothetical protein